MGPESSDSPDAATAAPLPGLSIVTVVRNRSAHLQETAPRLSSWGGHAEHLIVDWGSDRPIRRETLPDDPRIRLLRVEGEGVWQLSRAYNFAIARARHELVLKLDADCWLSDPQFQPGPLPAGQYRRSARGGGLNGLFLIRRDDFLAQGGFNEYLKGYGYDDKDLYQRLEKALICEAIPPGSFATFEHGDLERVAAQEAEASSGNLRRADAWQRLEAIARMEESKAINRQLAEQIAWGPQSPRTRYLRIDDDHWQAESDSIPDPGVSAREAARRLGTRVYLSHLLGLPERFLDMEIAADDLERIRRWRRMLRLSTSLRVALLVGPLRIGLRLSRRLERRSRRGEAADPGATGAIRGVD